MSIVRADKKIPAGILAILLGGLGIHKFYLGFRSAGLTMLALTIVGWTLACLGLHILAVGMHVVGFIEGIIYLTKSDSDFYRDYVIRRREWF